MSTQIQKLKDEIAAAMAKRDRAGYNTAPLDKLIADRVGKLSRLLARRGKKEPEQTMWLEENEEL